MAEGVIVGESEGACDFDEVIWAGWGESGGSSEQNDVENEGGSWFHR